MRAVFDHRKDEASNISTFYFKPETPLQYTAGQFIELSIPHTHHDARGHKRWFTLSSSPHEPLLAITTKFASEHGSSFKQALQQLQPGNEVTMSEALGDFVLPKLLQTPLVFVALGMGITPFRSILAWLTETNEARPITMLYGVSSEDEIIFQDIIDKAHQHVTQVVRSPSAAWGGEQGEVTAELIMGIVHPNEDALIYLSGPELMVQKLSHQLIGSGVHKQQLVLDEFPNYQSI